MNVAISAVEFRASIGTGGSGSKVPQGYTWRSTRVVLS